MIISAGPTNSSLPRGCSPWLRPGSWRANPDEELTDWRAVCGRTARTVRRAGRARSLSDPYTNCAIRALPTQHSVDFAAFHPRIAAESTIAGLHFTPLWRIQMTNQELAAWRSQIVMSNPGGQDGTAPTA